MSFLRWFRLWCVIFGGFLFSGSVGRCQLLYFLLWLFWGIWRGSFTVSQFDTEIRISLVSMARQCLLNYFSSGDRSDLTLSPNAMSFNFNFLLHQHREFFVCCACMLVFCVMFCLFILCGHFFQIWIGGLVFGLVSLSSWNTSIIRLRRGWTGGVGSWETKFVEGRWMLMRSKFFYICFIRWLGFCF
jgi:uncharacterized membrane protein (DUF485 family)